MAAVYGGPLGPQSGFLCCPLWWQGTPSRLPGLPYGALFHFASSSLIQEQIGPKAAGSVCHANSVHKQSFPTGGMSFPGWEALALRHQTAELIANQGQPQEGMPRTPRTGGWRVPDPKARMGRHGPGSWPPTPTGHRGPHIQELPHPHSPMSPPSLSQPSGNVVSICHPHCLTPRGHGSWGQGAQTSAQAAHVMCLPPSSRRGHPGHTRPLPQAHPPHLQVFRAWGWNRSPLSPLPLHTLLQSAVPGVRGMSRRGERTRAPRTGKGRLAGASPWSRTLSRSLPLCRGCCGNQDPRPSCLPSPPKPGLEEGGKGRGA